GAGSREPGAGSRESGIGNRESGIGKLNQEQRAASLRSCRTAAWLVALLQQARARRASESSPRGWLIATRGLLRAAQRFPRPQLSTKC
ncbi:hypothetical protein FQJ94_07740, partial [Xanthomonas vasicola]